MSGKWKAGTERFKQGRGRADHFQGTVTRHWEVHYCPHGHLDQDVALRCAKKEAARRNEAGWKWKR